MNKFDPKKLRAYNTKEGAEWACQRSNIRREPVQLKNGRWAAMHSSEKLAYEQFMRGTAK